MAGIFWGELIGTFILVFVGCGAVTASVLFSVHNLFQVAIIWGLGVTLAIYVSRFFSNAHLNPAVSVAMVLGRRMPRDKLPVYIVSQFLGAFLAAAVLYVLFHDSISQYEHVHGLVRGAPESIQSAMIFTEFYPNPAVGVPASVSTLNAFAAEAMGTFILVFMIFALTDGSNLGRPGDMLAPVFIGLTVSMVICIIAPLTQAGLNPARDLSPRLFTFLSGWGTTSFQGGDASSFIVYGLGPLAGGTTAAALFSYFVEPLLKKYS